MLKHIQRLLGAAGEPPPPPEPETHLPAEIVALIETASIRARGEPDPIDGTQRLLVTMGTQPAFYWTDAEEAAARLARRHGLTPKQAERAAKLLAHHCAQEQRESWAAIRANLRPKTRRYSIWDW